MASRTSTESAARVRAALAYAGIDVKQAPARTGISYATLTRIVSPSSPRGASLDELYAIADACDVPRWFMDRGFAGPEASDVTQALQQRLDALEAEWELRFAQLERDRQETLAELARLSAVQASEQLDSGALPSNEPAPSTTSTREGSGRTR